MFISFKVTGVDRTRVLVMCNVNFKENTLLCELPCNCKAFQIVFTLIFFTSKLCMFFNQLD